MKIMATGGVLEADDSCKMAQRGNGPSAVRFKYTKPIDWHFRYRHAIDDHNNLRHALPSIEGTCHGGEYVPCTALLCLEQRGENGACALPQEAFWAND